LSLVIFFVFELIVERITVTISINNFTAPEINIGDKTKNQFQLIKPVSFNAINRIVSKDVNFIYFIFKLILFEFVVM
jgi:hypothetical protein